jgi:hypothetical protein
MELISSIGALITAAVAAIAGHFVAHDLYEGAPRYAKRLLKHAVSVLPKADRERYGEEWLAHLHECDGVIGKFRHAIGCLLVARKLRQIVERRTTLEPSAVEFVFLSKGESVANVSMDETTVLPLLKMMEEALKDPDRTLKGPFVPSEEIVELMEDPDVDLTKFIELRAAAQKVQETGNFGGVKIRVVDRLGRILTADDIQAWMDNDQN